MVLWFWLKTWGKIDFYLINSILTCMQSTIIPIWSNQIYMYYKYFLKTFMEKVI